jgi:hypothetical protein
MVSSPVGCCAKWVSARIAYSQVFE